MTAKVIDLLAADTELTGDGNGGQGIRIPQLTMASVLIHLASSSGTTNFLSMWLQISHQQSANGDWFDFPYDLKLVSAAAKADLTADENKRNILDDVEDVTDQYTLALFKHLPAAYARLAWATSGSGLSYTFGAAKLIGK